MLNMASKCWGHMDYQPDAARDPSSLLSGLPLVTVLGKYHPVYRRQNEGSERPRDLREERRDKLTYTRA